MGAGPDPAARTAGDSMFHFGWFVGKGYSVHGWNQPWTGAIAADWMEPDIYMDLAACPRTRLLRLPDHRGWVVHRRRVSGLARMVPAQCLRGTEERSDAAGAAAGLRHQAPGHRRHRHHQFLPALSRGAAGCHARSSDAWPGRAERGDRAQRPVGAEFWPRPALRARPALRDGRRMDGGGQSPVGIVGARRDRGEPGDRRVRRLYQGAPDPFRRPLLQVAWAAEHRAGAATTAGDLPGGRLAGRPGVCRQACRPDHRQGAHRRGGEELSAGHLAADGTARARAGRLQGDVQHLRRHRRHAGRRRARSGRGRPRRWPTRWT